MCLTSMGYVLICAAVPCLDIMPSICSKSYVIDVPVIARKPALILNTELQDLRIAQTVGRQGNLAALPFIDRRIAPAAAINRYVHHHAILGVSGRHEAGIKGLICDGGLEREDQIFVRADI